MKVFDKIFLWILGGAFVLIVGYLACGFLMPSYVTLSPEEVRKMVGNAPPDAWVLAPKNAHPRAAKLLKDEFFWNCTDDDSPFGNDNGADALRLFRHWRLEHPEGKPVLFIEELLLQWQAPLAEWKKISPDTAGSIIFAGNGYILDTGDGVIISVAFGQLLLDGRVDSDLRSLGLEAIEREKNPHLLKHWVEPEERKARLNKMESILRAL